MSFSLYPILCLILLGSLTYTTQHSQSSLKAQSYFTNPIPGTDEQDNLIGTDEADNIEGHGKDDVVQGKGGNDRIEGEKGSDRLYGDAGNDVRWRRWE
jgi:Ca2+-binding RTX toxin-like protein